MDLQCGSRCSSRLHASEVNSAITLGRENEDRVLNYVQRACFGVFQNKDRDGRTALHVAASCGRLKIVDWLTSNKDIQLNGKDSESGYSPLHRAAFYGQLHVARLLINKNANLHQLDNDSYTPLDHLMKDRLPGNLPEANQPCEVYVWGSNSNYTLGQNHQLNRAVPEVLDSFRRDGTSLRQVAMGKFHSVFVAKSGQVYSCGHGQGGRLGHDDERSVVCPQLIKAVSAEVCIQVVVGMDHTVFLMESGSVWSCGTNQYHQLGHSPPPVQLLSPKPLSFASKAKSSVTGICAGRFHTVFWNDAAVFTCGLNAGQLGHLKGDMFITTPKQVTCFTMKDMVITHVAASDGATAVATKKGDVYVLHEYQCRKIASKQLELEKVVMIGGNLDQKLNPGLLTEQGGHELQVVLLTKSGKIFVWRETHPQLTRCLFHIGRPLVIKDLAMNLHSMIMITQEGEGFMGVLVSKRSKKLTSQSEQKDNVIKSPSSTLFEFVEREACDHIKLKRIPSIFRAVAVACDPKGENFAAIQMHPAANLVDVPSVLPSTFNEDLSSLLQEADPTDYIHDIEFKVGYQKFAAHRYVLASRCESFYKSVCEANIDLENEDEIPVVSIEDVPAHTFHQILKFIYTGTCDLLKPGRCSFFASTTTKSGNEQISNENLQDSQANKKAKKKGKKVKQKPEVEDVVSEDMQTLRGVIDCVKKLGLYPLAKLLEKVTVTNGYVSMKERFTQPRLKFKRHSHSELHDVQIRSEDGKLFDAHRCMLAARLDYFRSMFGCGWIETTSSDEITLPIPGVILEVLLDFFYEDEARKIDSCDDIEFVGNVLVVADQFLISRLVSLCESTLVSLITVKNAGELLEFAATYNADQLKQSCMQFICLNLPAIVELRSWDCVSDEVMEDLTSYYRSFNPVMAYRFITPSSQAPSIDTMDLYCDSEPLQLLNTSLNGEDCKRPKVKRRSGRRISEGTGGVFGRERQLSTSSVNSLDSVESESQPIRRTDFKEPIREVETKQPRSGWSVVKKTPKKSKDSAKEEQVPEKKASSPVALPQPKTPPHPTTPPRAPPTPQLASTPRMATPPRVELFPSLMEAAHIQTPVANAATPAASRKFSRPSQKQRKSAATSGTPPLTTAAAAATPAWEPKAAATASFADILRDEELKTRLGATPKNLGPAAPAPNPRTFVSQPWRNGTDGKAAAVQTKEAACSKISFEDILADEMQQKMNLVKARSKPLALTQMEDQAMEELLAFYHADEVFDEHIVVERVVVGALATPVWRH